MDDPLIYSSERPEYINYAIAGTFLGHEIMHAFDSIDEYIDIWETNSTTKDEYAKHLNCLQEQYASKKVLWFLWFLV